MRTKPVLPVVVLLLALFIAIGATALIIRNNPLKGKEKAGTLIRLSVIYLLVFLIGLRPMMTGGDYDFSASNLNVIFVVDTTISMWAEDYGNKSRRIQRVAKDAEYIIDELSGADFALVTFDNRSRVLSPLTQESEYIKDCINTLSAPEMSKADGSSMSLPRENLTGLVKSSSKKENKKTIVFFMSDGENTDGRQTASYAELAKNIAGGAVIGYGTETGGRMKNKNGGYIYDRENDSYAISKIDEDNLKAIAGDMGLKYIKSEGEGEGLKGILTTIRETARTITDVRRGLAAYHDIYYYPAALLAIMVLYEIIRFIRKGRL